MAKVILSPITRRVHLNASRRLATWRVGVNDSRSEVTPAAAAFAAVEIEKHRVAMNGKISGGMKLRPRAQRANTPDDDTPWILVRLFGADGTLDSTIAQFIVVAR